MNVVQSAWERYQSFDPEAAPIFVRIVEAVSSHVFVPLVFESFVFSASVTYLLSAESAMSAVVSVTTPLCPFTDVTHPVGVARRVQSAMVPALPPLWM